MLVCTRAFPFRPIINNNFWIFQQISQPGKVKFLDEITSIDKEAKNLKAKGVNIIIAVGHSGFEKDQEIAKNVPDVDVVVGGHSNTFLYNGQSPSSPEKRLQDISAPYFSTTSFNPGLFNHELFNHGLFNHEFFNLDIFFEKEG